MATVADGVHADAGFLRALDCGRGGFPARTLPVAEISLELKNGTGVLQDRGRRVGMELSGSQIARILGDHSDAVAVVAAKVGFK